MDNGGMHYYRVYLGGEKIKVQADGYEVHPNGSVSFWLNLGHGNKAVSVHIPVAAFTMIERADLSNLYADGK